MIDKQSILVRLFNDYLTAHEKVGHFIDLNNAGQLEYQHVDLDTKQPLRMDNEGFFYRFKQIAHLATKADDLSEHEQLLCSFIEDDISDVFRDMTIVRERLYKIYKHERRIAEIGTSSSPRIQKHLTRLQESIEENGRLLAPSLDEVLESLDEPKEDFIELVSDFRYNHFIMETFYNRFTSIDRVYSDYMGLVEELYGEHVNLLTMLRDSRNAKGYFEEAIQVNETLPEELQIEL
jgi:hypothetical protein